MSVEHQPLPGRTPEHATTDLEVAAKERLEQLKHTPELAAEHHAEKRAEAAREVIHRQELPPTPEATPAEPRPTLSQHFDRTLNYKQTLASLQRRLTPASRLFSHVIHTSAVERASESLERTVARPSILNGAVWGAAIVGLIFYVTARAYGFMLSGSEMLLALVGGGLLGVIFETIGRIFRRR